MEEQEKLDTQMCKSGLMQVEGFCLIDKLISKSKWLALNWHSYRWFYQQRNKNEDGNMAHVLYEIMFF